MDLILAIAIPAIAITCFVTRAAWQRDTPEPGGPCQHCAALRRRVAELTRDRDFYARRADARAKRRDARRNVK